MYLPCNFFKICIYCHVMTYHIVLNVETDKYRALLAKIYIGNVLFSLVHHLRIIHLSRQINILFHETLRGYIMIDKKG